MKTEFSYFLLAFCIYSFALSKALLSYGGLPPYSLGGPLCLKPPLSLLLSYSRRGERDLSRSCSLAGDLERSLNN